MSRYGGRRIGSKPRYEPRPQAEKLLGEDPEVRTMMNKPARAMAAEVARRAPKIVKGKGMKIYAEDGRHIGATPGAKVVVRSSFWHWPEYGTSKYPAAPYIRPGVQAVLSERGGRWEDQTSRENE